MELFSCKQLDKITRSTKGKLEKFKVSVLFHNNEYETHRAASEIIPFSTTLS